MRAIRYMTIKYTNLLVLVALLSFVSACSGDKARSCDDVQRYQLAVEGERIETPDDLDDLDPLLVDCGEGIEHLGTFFGRQRIGRLQ